MPCRGQACRVGRRASLGSACPCAQTQQACATPRPACSSNTAANQMAANRDVTASRTAQTAPRQAAQPASMRCGAGMLSLQRSCGVGLRRISCTAAGRCAPVLRVVAVLVAAVERVAAGAGRHHTHPHLQDGRAASGCHLPGDTQGWIPLDQGGCNIHSPALFKVRGASRPPRPCTP